MKSKITYLLLFLITILALVLRIYKSSDAPPGLNRDEAAIGYTAYSLLQTGKDEYGKSWPISFKSFGDWKVPVYFYLDMPFIKIFGLNELATRLPSILSGTLTVFLVFFLVKGLFSYNNKNNKTDSVILNIKLPINVIALVSTFIFAINPWSIFMSRNASESNVAVFLVVISLVLFFKSFQKIWLIIPSFFILSLSIFTYHGNHIFTPLLFIGIIFFYWPYLKKNKYFRLGLIAFIIPSILIYSQTLFSADKTKISGLFPLGDEAKVYENIVMRRLEYANQNFLVKILHNKSVYLLKTIVNNYLKGLSPEFLFINGGANNQHNIPGFGNLYIWEAFIWPIGIFALLLMRKPSGFFLIWWLLIAPIAGSITKDAPHTNRMMGILPLPPILSAIGLVFLVLLFQKSKTRKIISILLSIIIIFNLLIYLDQYFVHFPYVSAKNWGNVYKQMVYKVNQIENNYQEIFISKPDISPYIYFLFYNRINPLKFQKEVIRYPQTDEGFLHIKKFGKYNFEKINWTDELLIPDRLYIDWADGMPTGATNSSSLITKDIYSDMQQRNIDISNIKIGDIVNSRVIDKIFLPDKSIYIYLIETRKIDSKQILN